MAKMMLELSHDEVNREIPYVMVAWDGMGALGTPCTESAAGRRSSPSVKRKRLRSCLQSRMSGR